MKLSLSKIKIEYIVFLMLCIWYLYPINQEIPMMADEISRIYHIKTNDSIIINVWKQYLEQSGRIFILFFCFVLAKFEWLSGGIFSILNSLAYGAFVIGIVKIAGGDRLKSWARFLTLVIFSILIWLCSGSIGAVALWKTGSIGYLWPATLWVWVCVEQIKANRGVDYPLSGLRILVCLGAMIASNSIEIISMPWLLVSTFAFWSLHRKQRLNKYFVAIYSCQLIGFVMLFGAPGNFGRLDMAGSIERINYFDRSVSSLANYIAFESVLIYCLLLVLCTAVFIGRASYMNSNVNKLTALMFVGSVLFCVTAVPWVLIENRIGFLFEVYVCVMIASVFIFAFDQNVPLNSILFLMLAVILTLVGVADRNKVLWDYKYINAVMADREKSILWQKNNGVTDVVTYPLVLSSKNRMNISSGEYMKGRYFILDISPKADNWINGLISQRYGLNSIRIGNE